MNKHLPILVLALISTSLCAQKRDTVYSAWVTEPTVLYNTQATNFEQTDTLVILPNNCIWRRLGICCGYINHTAIVWGGLLENRLSTQHPDGNTQVGLMIGSSVFKQGILRNEYELWVKRSLRNPIWDIGLGAHKTIISRSLYGGHHKVPKLLVGVKGGVVFEPKENNVYVKPVLSYVLPTARAHIFAAYQFNLKETSYSTIYSDASLGLKIYFPFN